MDSSTVDPGSGGFLGIFGADAPAETAAQDAGTDTHDAAQDRTTAAEHSPPEDAPDADLSADEVVAARLAASLEADGIALPEPDAADAAPAAADPDHPLLADPGGEPSLDDLTPEQLRALAEEAIRLRGEVATGSRHETARKVAAAEAAAVAQVQAAYEQEVLAVADRHYAGVFEQRLAALIGESTEQELPARAAALAAQVYAARQAWESEQADRYEQAAQQAALAARKGVPEMRQLYAAELVRRSGLPDAAVAEVLKTANTDEFPQRVDELVGIRDALLAERARNATQRRQEANARLRDTTPRTAATGRPPGGKPPAYTGAAAEGVAIVRTL